MTPHRVYVRDRVNRLPQSRPIEAVMLGDAPAAGPIQPCPVHRVKGPQPVRIREAFLVPREMRLNRASDFVASSQTGRAEVRVHDSDAENPARPVARPEVSGPANTGSNDLRPPLGILALQSGLVADAGSHVVIAPAQLPSPHQPLQVDVIFHASDWSTFGGARPPNAGSWSVRRHRRRLEGMAGGSVGVGSAGEVTRR